MCPICATELTFLMQLYANVDALKDFHRSIYVFACLGEKCISTKDSVRCFREVVADKNSFMRVCTDDEFLMVEEMTDA